MWCTPLADDGRELCACVSLLLERLTQRKGKQPQRGLLVRRQVGDLVNGVFDVAKRLAQLDQLRDGVPVAGKRRPCVVLAHTRNPPLLGPVPAGDRPRSRIWSWPLSQDQPAQCKPPAFAQAWRCRKRPQNAVRLGTGAPDRLPSPESTKRTGDGT